MILLFGNSFGAQATAYQLTGGQVPSCRSLIGNQISGDVLHNVGLGYAMAMGMVVDHGRSRSCVYTWLQRRVGAVASDDERRSSRRTDSRRRQRSSGAPSGRRPARRSSGSCGRGSSSSSAFLYFVVPLLATFEFSMQAQAVPRGLHELVQGPGFFASLGYSFIVGDHHGRPEHRADRADRVLGPAAGAAAAARSSSSSRCCRSSSRRSCWCSA